MPRGKKEIYHCSRTPLDIGTVLESHFVKYLFQWDAVKSALDEPDRGPILKSLLLADRFIGKGKSVLPFVLKEVALERVRASEFPERPGRLQSIFVCPSKAAITEFRESIKKVADRPHLYLCTIDRDASVFEADMQYVRASEPLAPINDQLNQLIERARLYWQGHKCDNPVPEILVSIGGVSITAEAQW